jgi:hypothetical protein
MQSRIGAFVVSILAGLILTGGTFAQSRDYFTADEVELIRDAQDIDLRIMVLTHSVDRRLVVLKIESNGVPAKEPEKWGPLPTGSRLELFTDIKRIIQKAIDDIDDTAAHAGTKMEREIENTDRSKKDKSKDKSKEEKPFHRAVRLLAEAASKYKPLFAAQLDSSSDPKEKGVILASIDLCDQIMAAAAKPY